MILGTSQPSKYNIPRLTTNPMTRKGTRKRYRLIPLHLMIVSSFVLLILPTTNSDERSKATGTISPRMRGRK